MQPLEFALLDDARRDGLDYLAALSEITASVAYLNGVFHVLRERSRRGP